MTEPRTFWQWLKRQDDRNDFIGDLARDAVQDDTFPRRAKHYDAIKWYLIGRNACRPAQIALARAFREWRRYRAV